MYLAILHLGDDWVRWFAGMERNRSKLGEWMDEHGISQTNLSDRSGVSYRTVQDLVRGESKRPTKLTARKLMKAIREVDPVAKESDFWDV